MATRQYPNLLTTQAKVIQTELMYYSPVYVSPVNYNVLLSSVYCFLGNINGWDDNNNPPIPGQTPREIKEVFKNMFVIKRILSNNVSPVIKRYDWSTGNVYDYYRDDVDILETNTDGSAKYNFYVKNRYDQVFKCLWNNNSSVSTAEPYFEPGTYGTDDIFYGADGYKWKFIFTVDSGAKVNFMDSSWIPLPVGEFAIGVQGDAQSTIGSGAVEVINVTNGGSGYNPAIAEVKVTITGDGTGATATARVVGGVIQDIIVTNPGTDYTYANVTITSVSPQGVVVGSGATAFAPVSPIGGHGSDPTSELGSTNIMFVCEFNGSETNSNGQTGIIPTNITYYQVGLLINPSSKVTTPNPANETIISLTTNLNVASGFGSYNLNEVVYQSPTGLLQDATFTGKVLDWDNATHQIRVINTSGTITTNLPVFGSDTKTVRTLLAYDEGNFVPFTGYISYIENRTGVSRSTDGIEQFKFVLGY